MRSFSSTVNVILNAICRDSVVGHTALSEASFSVSIWSTERGSSQMLYFIRSGKMNSYKMDKHLIFCFCDVDSFTIFIQKKLVYRSTINFKPIRNVESRFITHLIFLGLESGYLEPSLTFSFLFKRIAKKLKKYDINIIITLFSTTLKE